MSDSCRYAHRHSTHGGGSHACVKRQLFVVFSVMHFSAHLMDLGSQKILQNMVKSMKITRVASFSPMTVTHTHTCVNTKRWQGTNRANGNAHHTLTTHTEQGRPGYSGSCVVSATVVRLLNDCRQREEGWVSTHMWAGASTSHSQQSSWFSILLLIYCPTVDPFMEKQY